MIPAEDPYLRKVLMEHLYKNLLKIKEVGDIDNEIK
jgi:hypothetical protein